MLYMLCCYIDAIIDVYRGKPLIFIGATFREKLVSHQQAVNEAESCPMMGDKHLFYVKYSVRNSLDRIFSNLYLLPDDGRQTSPKT